MYKYVHNNKYQMKYREFVKHSEARKEVKDNIYANQGWNFFLKNNLKLYTGALKSGSQGWILVATKFFQVSCHFSMIFIKFFKIPWYFQVFQVYSHFPGFPGRVGTLHHLYQVQDLLSFQDLWDKMLISALQGHLHSGDEQLRLMAAVNRNFGLSLRTQKFILF